MALEITSSQPREEKIKDIRDFIITASIAEMRLIDIALKDRKHEIISNGLEVSQPAISLIACEIRGREYIYSQETIEGRKVTQKVKERDIATYDFAKAKISPKAREVLQEKYGIKI